MTCRHTGCNYPEGECAGACAKDYARRSTSDAEYAALLARLNAMPTFRAIRRSYTKAQERQQLHDDITAQYGEAPW